MDKLDEAECLFATWHVRDFYVEPATLGAVAALQAVGFVKVTQTTDGMRAEFTAEAARALLKAALPPPPEPT